MAVRKDEIQIKITIDAAEQRKFQKSQKALIDSLEAGFSGLTKDSKEYQKQLQKLQTEQKKLVKTQTFNQLRGEYSKLSKEIKKLTPGTTEFIAKSARLDIVTTEYKKLNAQIRGTNKGTKALGTTSKTAFGQMQKGISLVNAAMQASIIFLFVQKLFEVGKAFLGAANEAEAAAKKISIVFGDAEVIVNDFAEEISESMGVAQGDVKLLAAEIGDLLIPMGFQREEAANLAKSTLQLSGALSEWTGGQKDAAEVSKILTKAYLGEREELKSLGLSISEADVQARLAAKGMQNLTGESLKQAKAVSTLELIFEKSGDAQNPIFRKLRQHSPEIKPKRMHYLLKLMILWQML